MAQVPPGVVTGVQVPGYGSQAVVVAPEEPATWAQKKPLAQVLLVPQGTPQKPCVAEELETKQVEPDGHGELCEQAMQPLLLPLLPPEAVDPLVELLTVVPDELLAPTVPVEVLVLGLVVPDDAATLVEVLVLDAPVECVPEEVVVPLLEPEPEAVEAPVVPVLLEPDEPEQATRVRAASVARWRMGSSPGARSLSWRSAPANPE